MDEQLRGVFALPEDDAKSLILRFCEIHNENKRMRRQFDLKKRRKEIEILMITRIKRLKSPLGKLPLEMYVLVYKMLI